MGSFQDLNGGVGQALHTRDIPTRMGRTVALTVEDIFRDPVQTLALSLIRTLLALAASLTVYMHAERPEFICQS